MIDGLRQALLDGRHAEAWRIYDQLREAGEPGPETHLLGGRAALARGDLHSARTALERALEAGAAGSTRGQALLILGDVRRRTGALREAAETLERWLEEMPAEYPNLGAMWRGACLRNLGLTYRQMGELERARDTYRQGAAECRAENLPGLLGRTLRNLAWVCCLLEQPEEAAGALAEAESLCQNESERWHQRLGWAHVELLQGWQPSTTAFSREALAESSTAPADVRAHAAILLGREALRRGDLAIARQCAEQAVDMAMTDRGDSRALNDAAEFRQLVLTMMNLKSAEAGA
ncbi:MAG: tetratricopeptide repeat protein [Bacillota bacterium]